jgi:hypothetical protein
MIEMAAERGDLTTVVRLARAAERVLFLAGRWEAWHHTLSQGLAAARASADRAEAAFFAHQQGTLAFCQDQLEDARELLQQALSLREQVGDAEATDVTRHNLRLLTPPDPTSPPRPRVLRRVMPALGGVAGTLALVVGTVAITTALQGGAPVQPQPSDRPSTSTPATAPASTPGQSPSPSPPSSPTTPIGQAISFTSSPPSPALVGGTYTVAATGGGSRNPVVFTVDRGSSTVCSISGSTVTFGAPGSCVIDANQAGNTAYQPAPEAQQAIAVKAAQSITFTSTPPQDPYKGVTYTVTATGGGSGNPVTFSIDSSSTSAGCSVSGSTVTFGGPGTCVIDANQGGNGSYQPATQAQQAVKVNSPPATFL